MSEKEIKRLAKQLHDWYLEGVAEYGMDHFNPDAIVQFEDLPEPQQKLDEYIARKVLTYYSSNTPPPLTQERIDEIMKRYSEDYDD